MCVSIILMEKSIVLFSPQKDLFELSMANNHSKRIGAKLYICTSLNDLYCSSRGSIITYGIENESVVKSFTKTFPTELEIVFCDINNLCRTSFKTNINIFTVNNEYNLDCFLPTTPTELLIKRIIKNMLNDNITHISNRYYRYCCMQIGLDPKVCSPAIREYIKHCKLFDIKFCGVFITKFINNLYNYFFCKN